MARGRFVSKSISTSEQLASGTVSLRAAMLFTWCIPHLDVDGRIKGSPAWIKAEVVPLRDEYSIPGIAECLAEICAAGLVQWYRVNGLNVLQFNGFSTHNTVRRDRESPSQLPAYTPEGATMLPEPSRSSPGEGPEDARRPPDFCPQVKVSEVKLSEDSVVLRTTGAAPRSDSDLTDGQLMGLVRQHLYVPDGKAPKGYSDGRDVKIIRALRKKGLTGYQIADAIEGLRLMCDDGELGVKRPREKLTMRALFNTKHGVRPLLFQAQEAVYQREKHAAPLSHSKAKGPEHISAALERLVPRQP